VVTVLSNLVNFVLPLPILLILLLTSGHSLPVALVSLPIVIAAQFVFTLACGYLLASIYVSFRDTQYLLGVFLMLGFYLVPVFYDPGAIPTQYQQVYGLNPLVHFMAAYRAIFMRSEMPYLPPILTAGSISVVALVFSYWVFMRAAHRFVEDL